MPIDRVAIAFRKFDLDNDGFLSWDEFTQVTNLINNEAFHVLHSNFYFRSASSWKWLEEYLHSVILYEIQNLAYLSFK